MTRAVESPLVRGGLMIIAGIVAGNLLGFVRVAATAYLLGTGSRADALAVALGPIDSLNQVLINAMLFTFVPLLTDREGADRARLFVRIRRVFAGALAALSAAIALFAPQLVRMLAPGLTAEYTRMAEEILRITAISPLVLGLAGIHGALLYTRRRFAPTAFNQATINVFTILIAVGLWERLGVYGFAAGYTAGACGQCLITWLAARTQIDSGTRPSNDRARDLLLRPAPVAIYAALLAVNIIVTRGYATHIGPGTAAALEYCLRCLGVPLAFLVSPAANSLLPEISRMARESLWREARALTNRTLLLIGAAAVASCAVAIAVREPVIALIFQRGSFTPDSTRLVSAVFLGFAPSLVGWSLLEIAGRSLFAMNRPWPPAVAAAMAVGLNAIFIGGASDSRPAMLGVGASVGLIVAFAFLVTGTLWNRRWIAELRGRS